MTCPAIFARQPGNLTADRALPLSRAFKESTGLSPHQFILRRRVERALQMLKEKRTNLADIAYDLGFSSQGHFTTVFSKIVGVSPSSYREQVHPLKRMGLCYETPEGGEQ